MTRSRADVVGRVVEQAEDGQDVLDLLALVEADAADDPVGDVADPERLFNGRGSARWCGTSPRRRRSATPSSFDQAPDLVDDELRFVALVGQLAQDDRARRRRSRCAGGGRSAGLVFADDAVGGLDDAARSSGS